MNASAVKSSRRASPLGTNFNHARICIQGAGDRSTNPKIKSRLPRKQCIRPHRELEVSKIERAFASEDCQTRYPQRVPMQLSWSFGKVQRGRTSTPSTRDISGTVEMSDVFPAQSLPGSIPLHKRRSEPHRILSSCALLNRLICQQMLLHKPSPSRLAHTVRDSTQSGKKMAACYHGRPTRRSRQNI